MTDEASRRGRSSRRKGAQGERELASLLSDELGIPIRRMLGQERDGGADLHIGPLRIQVKRCQALQMAAWWRQTLDDAGDGIPILAYRASRKPWTFRLPLGNLICELAVDESEWAEMPLASFAFWVREKVDLRYAPRGLVGELVKIKWKNPSHEWPYFRVLAEQQGHLRLQDADYPDGSAKHDGDVFWVAADEIERIHAIPPEVMP